MRNERECSDCSKTRLSAYQFGHVSSREGLVAESGVEGTKTEAFEWICDGDTPVEMEELVGGCFVRFPTRFASCEMRCVYPEIQA